MNILSLIFTNFRACLPYLLIITAIGTFSYIEYLKLKVSDLSGTTKMLDYRLNESQENVKHLASTILEQNLAIDKLNNDATERLARNQADLLKAKSEAKKNKLRADELEKKLASTPDDKCLSANDLINEEIKSDVR